MYTKVKAEKLAKEFNYLETKSYFPFGSEGREFKISRIENWLLELEFSPVELVIIKKNPNYKNKKIEEYENGANWKVFVIITDKGDDIKLELEEVLKVLQIRHNIDKSFNH